MDAGDSVVYVFHRSAAYTIALFQRWAAPIAIRLRPFGAVKKRYANLNNSPPFGFYEGGKIISKTHHSTIQHKSPRPKNRNGGLASQGKRANATIIN